MESAKFMEIDVELQATVSRIFSKYRFLSAEDICDIECTLYKGLLYLCCYVDTYCPIDYTVIYEQPLCAKKTSPSKVALREDDYWSNFNSGSKGETGKGAALVVLDPYSLNIAGVFYFKDTYGEPSGSHLVDVSGAYVVVGYGEYCYIFNKASYTGLTFVWSGGWFRLSEDYWIIYPTYLYDAHCGFEVVDFKHERVFGLKSVDRWFDGYDFHDSCNCYFDVDESSLVFSHGNQKVSLPLHLLHVDDDDLDRLEYANRGSDIGWIGMRNVDNYNTWHQYKEIMVPPLNPRRWSSVNGLAYFSLYNYYPTKYQGSLTSLDEKVRRLIWNFKSSSYESHESSVEAVLSAVKSLLNYEFEELTECLTLFCVPASTERKYRIRYHDFSDLLCRALSMRNGFCDVTYLSDGSAKHLGGQEQPDIDIASYSFKNRFVILFDDVMTTGHTLCKYARLLREKGAIVIAAVTLGKTIYEEGLAHPIVLLRPHENFLE